MSVTLLKEEDKIQPLFDAFAKVQRRSFQSEGLQDAFSLLALPPEAIRKAAREGIDGLWRGHYPLSVKLFFLKDLFPSIYDLAVATFRSVFTTVTDCDVQQIKNPPVRIDARGLIPAFFIKEKGVNQWIPLHELSSGMQKVLLIVTDVLTLPKGSIYIIDEYENSLGTNAIDFLPQFLADHGENAQLLITTHHPYLINSMPMRTWKVFRRQGARVSIKSGEEFEKKYGRSKQRAFIQLINDPRQHYDVLDKDPELLPSYPKETLNRCQYAERYLRRLLNDKYRNLTYRKSNPSVLLHDKYFQRVRERLVQTGHIGSFDDFLTAFV